MKTLLTLIFAIAIAAMPAVSSANEPNASPLDYCLWQGELAQQAMRLRQQDVDYIVALDELVKKNNLTLGTPIEIIVQHAYSFPLLPPMRDAEKDKKIFAFGDMFVGMCLNALTESNP